MSHERTNNRYNSYAKVLMDGIPGYMRDISSDGFKYVTPLPVSARTGTVEQITVIPRDSSIQSFKLEGEIRWQKTDEEGFQVCGIRIIEFGSTEGDEIYRGLQDQFSL